MRDNPAERVARLRADQGGRRVHTGRQALQIPTPFIRVTVQGPVPLQRGGQSQTLLIARRVQQLTPDNTSLERTPAKRKGLIYLDYLQNSAGQTLAAPYSVRPAPAGAQVSTPLKWNELRRGLSPANFDIFNTLKRLDKVGDLWQPVLGPGIDLAAVVKRIGGEAEEAVQAAAPVKRQTASS